MILKLRFISLMMILLVVSSNIILGQSKGKISGVVIDAETKEPLPGANVIIEGTSYGAATNIDGQYYIINLEPKIYTLVASYIGYNKAVIEHVEVNTGQTTVINISLTSKAITSKEVVVIAQKPIIQKDVSSSQDVIYGNKLSVMPMVTDVKDYIGLQAGVQGLSIRGGSVNQTAVMINGALDIDPTTNQPFTGVPLSAIQEVSIIKGGFNAEYGNIRSGMINITTKDGDKSRYHVSVDYQISPAHQKHFGPSMFSPDSYYLRPYFDPQVAFTGTQNWPEYMRQQYPVSFQGWDKWVQENPQWGLTPKQAEEVFMWTHTVDAFPQWGISGSEALGQTGRTEGTQPDQNIDASLSGPFPFISDYLGGLTFFASFKGNDTYLAVPFVRPDNQEQDTYLKLTSHIAKGMKLSAQGIYSHLSGVNYNIGNGVDGSFMSVMNSLYQANRENTYYFWQSAWSPLDLYRSLLSVNFEHVLSPSTYYTFIGSYGTDVYKSDGYLSARDTTTLIKIGNVSLNQIPWGWSNSPFQEVVDQPDRRILGGGGGGMIWDHSHASMVDLKFDLFSQLNNYNGLKTGFDVNLTNMYVDRAKYKSTSKAQVLTEPPPQDWFSLQYNAFPVIGSFYIQDKIELEGMVANIGVRADYYNTNTISYFVDPYSKYYGGQYASVFTDSIPQARVKGKLKWSPRIGIAFPIAERAKFYFNYGHFYEYPTSSEMYGILRGENQKITQVGNPNAELPETVAYELGVELNVADAYLLKVSGYYKDVTNQLTNVEYVSESSVYYNTVRNQNIADIRGLELSFEKNRGNWFRGWVNFTYMSTTGADIGRGIYYQDPQLDVQTGYINYDASYTNPVPQPYARADLDFFTPNDLGDLWGNWHLTLLPSWQSGSYYTFLPSGKNLPQFANNIHWPDEWNVDMRLEKDFAIKGVNVSVYLEGSNIFNFKNFTPGVGYGFSDSYDRDAYLRSLHLPLYAGADYKAAGLIAGNDKVGDLRSAAKPYINDPNLSSSLWGETRQIFLGIKIDY